MRPFATGALYVAISSAFTQPGEPTGKRDLARLASSDLYVFPTYHPAEGHSNSLNEAMALGLPVICTRTGFLEDAARQGALFVPPRDPAALRAAIETLAADPERRARMGEANRARVESEFTEEMVFRRWARVYRDVLGDAA